MKSVLISTKPKSVEKVVSGKKTIVVRKSRPTLETPFKCYIYCTKAHNKAERLILQPFGYVLGGMLDDLSYRCDGKVIGEFVCDKIIEIGNYQEVDYSYMLWVKDRETTNKLCKNACLSEFEIQDYLGENGGYGWHISDLVIYDEPKELSEFYQECKEYGNTGTINTPKKCQKCRYQYTRGLASKCRIDGLRPLTRPFQSWGYMEVEE